MDQVHCILGNFLVVPTFICKDARDPSGKMWNYLWETLYHNFPKITESSPFMYMFLATKLQVTDGDIEVIS